MPRVQYFATKADYELLVASNELFSNLYFVPDTSYPEKAYTFFKGLLSLPDLGTVVSKKYFDGPRYWVFPEQPKIRLRATPPIEGQRWYDLDGRSFKVAIQLTPNGVFRKKTVICGWIEANNSTGDTTRLYRQISKAFGHVYEKSKYFGSVIYVGADALALQERGGRLTGNPNLPPTDDFKRMKKA